MKKILEYIKKERIFTVVFLLFFLIFFVEILTIIFADEKFRYFKGKNELLDMYRMEDYFFGEVKDPTERYEKLLKMSKQKRNIDDTFFVNSNLFEARPVGDFDKFKMLPYFVAAGTDGLLTYDTRGQANFILFKFFGQYPGRENEILKTIESSPVYESYLGYFNNNLDKKIALLQMSFDTNKTKDSAQMLAFYLANRALTTDNPKLKNNYITQLKTVDRFLDYYYAEHDNLKITDSIVGKNIPDFYMLMYFIVATDNKISNHSENLKKHYISLQEIKNLKYPEKDMLGKVCFAYPSNMYSVVYFYAYLQHKRLGQVTQANEYIDKIKYINDETFMYLLREGNILENYRKDFKL